MTGGSTARPTARLWTGITALLLIIGSASSQGSTALNEVALPLQSEAITESPSGSATPLRKLDSTLGVTSRGLEPPQKPRVEDTTGNKPGDLLTGTTNGSQKDQTPSDLKSGKPKVPEPTKKTAKLQEKSSSRLEFTDNEDSKELEEGEGESEREPTTQSPKIKEESGGLPVLKEHEGEEEDKPEGKARGVSLANDTNVNYQLDKSSKGSKERNGPKGTQANTTNAIASGGEAESGREEGSKGPKAQVEVVDNSTLPKVLRLEEAEDKRKEVESLGSGESKADIESIKSTVILESKESARGVSGNETRARGVGEGDGETGNDAKTSQSPRGRTISFGGINEFLTNDNRSGVLVVDNGGITEGPVDQAGGNDRLKAGEVGEKLKVTDMKPYPYAKNYQVNSSEPTFWSGDSRVVESTEEVSALENTIGQRQQDKKVVVTEPSVVIDNSIQQFKAAYYKRSGNASRVTQDLDSTIPTTLPTSLQPEKREETLTTEQIALEKNATVFVNPSSPGSSRENDVPGDKNENAEARGDGKDATESLDLTGNGITEVVSGMKNESVPVAKDSTTSTSIPFAATETISMSRATENETLVQNSLEKVTTPSDVLAVTSVDVQTEPEESMLKISSFNVTEGSTRTATDQTNPDDFATTAPSLSTTTSSPESWNKSISTTEMSSVSGSVSSEASPTSLPVPESFSRPATLSESSPVTPVTEVTKSTENSVVSSLPTVDLPSNFTSTASPENSSPVAKETSPNWSTELQFSGTSIAPEGSQTLETEKSFTPDEKIESTTAKIEYIFVGLTESTASQQYVASSESPNSLTSDTEVTSPTSSSVESSTSFPSGTQSLSTQRTQEDEHRPSSETSDLLESVTTPSVMQISQDKNSSEDSMQTVSTLEFDAPDDSTASISEPSATDSTDSSEDLPTTLTNDSEQITTDAQPTEPTNFTDIPEIFSDSGRAVDSSSVGPKATSGSDNGATVLPTESTLPLDTIDISDSPDVSTEQSLQSESPALTSATGEEKLGSRIVENSSTVSPDSRTSSSTPDIEFTSTEETIVIVTDDSIEIKTRGAAPSLVQVVFEGSWSDVCPHLDTLRQSLADLLTSGLEKTVLASQIIFQKNPCSGGYVASKTMTEVPVTTLLLYVVDESGNFDGEMTKTLPSLYSKSPIKLQVNIRSFQLVQDSDSGNAIAVVVVSSVALICLVLLAGLLFIMRKRQTRFNYGERCRPVSLDAYSLDSVSAYNSVRRKGAARASKRSYGNPTFEDSSAIPSHPLNFSGLSTFCNEQNAIAEEFAGIPQVTARIDELPQGAEVKNRYANVVPLPETRVSLMKINNDPLTEYINANYVRGLKNATKYYIACQAPMESTVTDFWRMIWEQQSKVVIMLTDLVENGVEKCAEYVPPSEVTDCHRLYGDFQVTLKKRETKEKYAISTLHLKNLENNTFREISHIWYLWPSTGVQTDAAGLIAILLEARALQRGGPGPIVIHCSPGTGRTGTLIALDLGIRQYEITRTVDVPRVVYTIRRDRAGSVQTKEQYAFIYKALNLYATKLAGGALES